MSQQNWTKQLRFVRCGKANCRCAGGSLHGPYWYEARHSGGKVSWRYLGKAAQSDAQFDQDAPEPVNDARWQFSTRRMSLEQALRIMAFEKWPSEEDLKKRYRVLMSQHHPDKGGSTEVCQAIKAANEYLKKPDLKGWERELKGWKGRS